MRFLKFSTPLYSVAGCIALAVFSVYPAEGMGILIPLNGTIDTNHSGNAFVTHQLKVAGGGLVGALNTQSELLNGGTLNLDNGGRMEGGLDVLNARFSAGLNGPVSILLGKRDAFSLQGKGAILFDDVNVKGPGLGIMLSGGFLHTTQRTVLDMTGAGETPVSPDYADGISLTGSAGERTVALIDGSRVYADEAALDVDCGRDVTGCMAIVSGATLQGGRAGILQAGGEVTVVGGRVSGTGNDIQSLPGKGSGWLLYSNGTGSRSTLEQKAFISGKEAGLRIVDESASDPAAASPAEIHILSGATLEGDEGIRIESLKTHQARQTTVSSVWITDSHVAGRQGAAIFSSDGVSNIVVSGASSLTSRSDVLLNTVAGATVNLTFSDVLAPVTGRIINDGGISRIYLVNSTFTGGMQQVTQLTTDHRSRWLMTDNSTVDDLLNNGTILLSQPRNLNGNRLTVTGNYDGKSGQLVFSTVPGHEKPVSQNLIIHGDATGTTDVVFRNDAGRHAQEIEGIEIIHVDGQSAANAFRQRGRIALGAYDFHLMRDDHGWFLKSDVNDISHSNNHQHVMRPEVGSYLANQMTTLFMTTLHERAGADRYRHGLVSAGDQTSLWLRQKTNHQHFRDDTGQLQTSGTASVSQLGGDLGQWSSNGHDKMHLGVMAGYGNLTSYTRSIVSGYVSKGTLTGHSVGIYSTWYQQDDALTGAYADGQLMYNWFTAQVNADEKPSQRYNMAGMLASLEAGYTFSFSDDEREPPSQLVLLEPHAQISWNGVRPADITEADGTPISSSGNDNLQLRLGLRAFLHNKISPQEGYFQPFVALDWLHNTQRTGVRVGDVTRTQAGALNTVSAEVGIEGQISSHFSIWGDLGQQFGQNGFHNSSALLGIMYRF